MCFPKKFYGDMFVPNKLSQLCQTLFIGLTPDFYNVISSMISIFHHNLVAFLYNRLDSMLFNVISFLTRSIVLFQIRKRFVARLESYLEELYNYVSKKVTKEIGKCRPLWEIFHSIRFYLCKLIVDPMVIICLSFR